MHRIPNEQRHFRAEWLWSVVGALAVAGAVAWLAGPEPTTCKLAGAPDDAASPSRARASVQAVTFAPPPAPVESGEARYFTFGAEVACSFPRLLPDGFYVGVSSAKYGRAELCGAYLDVWGPRGDVRAMVVDHCLGCAAGQVNLSAAAFAQIADPRAGVARIGYCLVRDPEPPQELTYEVQPDSSASWLGILFGSTGNPLHDVAIRPAEGGPWRELAHGADNYWSLSGAGLGPFVARVTDIYGNRADISELTIEPGQRSTDTRLYPGAQAVAASSPSAATTRTAAPPKPSSARCER